MRERRVFDKATMLKHLGKRRGLRAPPNYHETRTRRTSHVCAHRTLQRVPLNTRYTFKQSSMLNGVGINCSYVAICTSNYQTAALDASAAHKWCIKCKAIVGTSAVHKCCARSCWHKSAVHKFAALMREHVLPAFLRTLS